jgi:hypothetical protein
MSDIFVHLCIIYGLTSHGARSPNLGKIFLLITEESCASLISDSGSRLTDISRLLLPSLWSKAVEFPNPPEKAYDWLFLYSANISCLHWFVP